MQHLHRWFSYMNKFWKASYCRALGLDFSRVRLLLIERQVEIKHVSRRAGTAAPHRAWSSAQRRRRCPAERSARSWLSDRWWTVFRGAGSSCTSDTGSASSSSRSPIFESVWTRWLASGCRGFDDVALPEFRCRKNMTARGRRYGTTTHYKK